MGCITVGVQNNSEAKIVCQLEVNNRPTGHGASYVNSLFIYPGVSCYVGDKWVIWVTLELPRTM